MHQLKNKSDLELAELYKSKDNRDALGILFKRYYHLVLGVCLKYFKDLDTAKDLTMRIFEKLIFLLKKHQIEFFKSWIYRVSQNECLMELRKNKTITNSVDNMALESMENEENLHLLKEKEDILERMEKELGLLPEEQQQCIKMFYLDKKTYQEISIQTGFTFMQVKSYIQNGKRNLKIKLSN